LYSLHSKGRDGFYCSFATLHLRTRIVTTTIIRRRSPRPAFRLAILVPDTPRPVHRQQRLRFDPFDPIPSNLKPLCQIPQKEINKHAAGSARAAVRGAQSRRDAFDSDDRRGAYGDLLARAAREFFVRFEGAGESGGVGEDAEEGQDLRDAVVGEHGQLAYTVWEERVWVGVGGRGEGCPGLSDQDLCAFPEEDCSVPGCAISVCMCARIYVCDKGKERMRDGYTDFGVLRTSARPGRTETYRSPSARVAAPCHRYRIGAGTPRRIPETIRRNPGMHAPPPRPGVIYSVGMLNCNRKRKSQRLRRKGWPRLRA
jgi:hypothetical protein